MKNKHVASILGVSPSYVSKTSAGLLKSERSQQIKELLNISDEDFKNLLIDEDMEEVCDCAIKFARTVATRQFATIISQTREKFLSPAKSKTEKIFNLIAINDTDALSLLSDQRMMDVCDSAISKSRSNKIRKFASLLKQLSLKLHTAISPGYSEGEE